MRAAFVLPVLAFVVGCAATSSECSAEGVPTVHISAPESGPWSLNYRMAAPASRLLFPRSPDTSRVGSWVVEKGFEIASTEEGEVIRRSDGLPFHTVRTTVPPVYRELPSDYAPFSPFGDGGILFHTGRLFACADACREGQQWRMKLDAFGRNILIDGERRIGSSSWIDGAEGRNIYVGFSEPLESDDFLAVLDVELPNHVREQLLTQLPLYLRHFRERLGTLPARPMLFASYDTNHSGGGWGRQGGVLPNQVFIHFYGKQWDEEMTKPKFGPDLSWHFAHESAHFYQRMLYGNGRQDSWIHEGGAEAMAALAMLEKDPTAAPYVQRRKEEAESNCDKELGNRSLHDSLADGKAAAAYNCGLILNLALDAQLRRTQPQGGGLYGLWRRYIEMAEGSKGGESFFLAAVEERSGKSLRERVAKAIRGPAAGLRLN